MFYVNKKMSLVEVITKASIFLITTFINFISACNVNAVDPHSGPVVNFFIFLYF